MTAATDTMVKSIPSLPEASDSCRFMPNPNPTTDACSRYFDVFLANLGYACPATRAKARPIKSAMAGVT